jgi:hypothetical protein
LELIKSGGLEAHLQHQLMQNQQQQQQQLGHTWPIDISAKPLQNPHDHDHDDLHAHNLHFSWIVLQKLDRIHELLDSHC